MIVFLTTAGQDYTIGKLLQRRRTALRRRVITLTYDELLSWRRLPVGNYILADIERLSLDERERVHRRMTQLRRCLPGHRVLNDPLASLDRTALLDALHRRGINDFRAVSAGGDLAALRFPVFLRHSALHTGSLSPLIHDPITLRRALATVAADPAWDLRDLLIVEYVDVRNDDGLFEKFSVFRIGSRYFATDYAVHDHWICKGEDEEYCPDDWDRHDLDFQRRNPHIELVRPIFELAGIDYGRIDYAFCGGRLQVFEINTNPMIDIPAAMARRWRRPMRLFNNNYVQAMRAFDSGRRGRAPLVAVPGALGEDDHVAGSGRRLRLRRSLRALGRLELEHEILRWRNRVLPQPLAKAAAAEHPPLPVPDAPAKAGTGTSQPWAATHETLHPMVVDAPSANARVVRLAGHSRTR